MKKTAIVLVLLFILSAALAEDNVDRIIGGMPLPQKVCQLFFVQPEQLFRTEKVNEPGRGLERAFGRFPVGGV